MSKTKEQKAAGIYGECLMCGTVGTKEKPTRRGLCANHHQMYWQLLKKLPDENKRKEFDDNLVADGKLLPKPSAQEDNPFIEYYEKLLPGRERKSIEAGLAASAKHLEQQKKGGKK